MYLRLCVMRICIKYYICTHGGSHKYTLIRHMIYGDQKITKYIQSVHKNMMGNSNGL